MKKTLIIRSIQAVETHVVRHPVLRHGRPKNDCIFEDDEQESSLHMGAFSANTLVGVSSAYAKRHPLLEGKNPYQVRGVAVLPSMQGQGIGIALMERVESQLKHKKCDLIWLNAREKAVDFYRRLNYRPFGEPFHIAKIGIHYCFYKQLNYV